MVFFLRLGLLVFLFFIFEVNLVAQQYLFDVEKIGVEDGLPSRRVFSIAQDTSGFIWVATSKGISRYDGYRFKSYNHSLLGIKEGALASIAFDVNNNLWYFGWNSSKSKNTTSGIINTANDSVYTVDKYTKGLLTAEDIAYINPPRNGKHDVYISLKKGTIYKFDGRLEEIYQLPNPVDRLKGGLRCEPIPDGSYWIIGNEIIHVKNKEQISRHQLPFGKRLVSSSPSVILETSAYDRKTDPCWKYTNEQFVLLKNESLSDTSGLFELQQGYFCWLTPEGLVFQNSQGSSVFHFRYQELGEVDNYKHLTAFTDRQGILWIGTETGLLKVVQKKNPFTILSPGNSIRGIYQDTQHFWIGGYKRNIWSDAKTGIQKEFHSSDPFTMLVPDRNGHLWLGTTGRKLLEYLPTKDTLLVHEFLNGVDLYVPFINSETENFWIGTERGVQLLDRKSMQIQDKQLLADYGNPFVRQFHENEEGIWLVSSNGLFLMDRKQETIITQYSRANGLPFDNFNHLHEDKDGIFWLATRGDGLIRWDRKKNSFKRFRQENGLSNNNLYAVYGDEYDNLWLPSDYGLIRFDKKTSNTQVYLPQNGIAHEEFNTFAHFQDKDGTLFFGGLNGVTKFHPRDMQGNRENEAPLYVTNLRVLNQNEENFEDKTGEFRAQNKISLSPTDKVLEVELTFLDYMKSSSNQYAYMVEGFHNHWIHTKENKITLTNLFFGNYHLKIKGRGATGTWSKAVLDIPVFVAAPFYLKWWFVLSMVLLTCGLVYFLFKLRLRKIKEDRKRLELEVKKRTKTIAAQAEELKRLDKAKTSFFSNITHEFRTPLTLIIGPLEQVMKKPLPKKWSNPLNGVLKNAQQLLVLINQLLDLSKLEGGKMQVELSRGNIVAYTKALVQRFKPLADKKELHLDFVANKEDWETHFDKRKWNKIVYNLLSNAIKFTPQKGTIELNLTKTKEGTQDIIKMTVKDTGSGIEAEKLDKIFDRFYQADDSLVRDYEGTGIGLALVKELVELQDGQINVTSVVGKGTSFEVKLPALQSGKTVSIEEVATSEITDFPFIVSEKEIVQPQVPVFTNATGREKLELLIIEDNEDMRAYIRQCIGETNYHITEASNGEDGIQKAQALIPDLIISDIMMPKKDGFAVTKAIRRQRSTSHIPLILLTAKASLDSRLKGIQGGADAYLTKPFSPEELVLRIKKLIEIRQLLQQRYGENAKLHPSTPSTPFSKEDEFIANLKSFILENIDSANLNGDKIGQFCNMSRMQVHRKIKALTNQTTTEYIRFVRLEVALQYLQEKNFNISEIAYKTGFSSPSHFSKSFKLKYGKSPSEVLKE